MRMIIALVAVCAGLVVVGVVELVTGLPLSLVALPASSLWAAWDAKRVRLHEYRTPVGDLGYVGVFIACMAMWLVMFPWYLATRWRMAAGSITRLDDVAAR